MVHSESAKPTANRAIKLKLDICKARKSLRRALCFVRERWQIFGSVPKAAIRCALSRWQHQGASARHRSTHAAASLWGCCVKGTRRASPSTSTTSATAVLFKHACALGCEGVVSKRLGSPYRSGRVDDWLKVKKSGSACGRARGRRGLGRQAPRTINLRFSRRGDRQQYVRASKAAAADCRLGRRYTQHRPFSRLTFLPWLTLFNRRWCCRDIAAGKPARAADVPDRADRPVRVPHWNSTASARGMWE